jgi:hypothetical protein
MLVDPVLPSTVAVMVALPAATPVTSPEFDTVANWLADVDQVIVLPEIAAPLAVRGVADSWIVPPVATEDDGAATCTLATVSGWTVSPDEPPHEIVTSVEATMSAARRRGLSVMGRIQSLKGERIASHETQPSVDYSHNVMRLHHGVFGVRMS